MTDLCKQSMEIRFRHKDIVYMMAKAIYEAKSQTSPRSFARIEPNIQYFLDRLYTTRMSCRMLINQNAFTFLPDHSPSPKLKNHVGGIKLNCDLFQEAGGAFEDAR